MHSNLLSIVEILATYLKVIWHPQVEGAVHAVPLVPGKNLPVLYLFWYLVFALLACVWSDGVCSRFVVISVRRWSLQFT